MRFPIAALCALALLALSPIADARGGGHGGSHHSSTHHSSTKAREHRSAAAKNEFKREHPCPSTGRTRGPCPGYVIDHVQPLKRGGADAPGNMQWQTTEAAKAKDKWE